MIEQYVDKDLQSFKRHLNEQQRIKDRKAAKKRDQKERCLAAILKMRGIKQ